MAHEHEISWTVEVLGFFPLRLGRCFDDVASESGQCHFGAAEGFESWDAIKVKFGERVGGFNQKVPI